MEAEAAKMTALVNFMVMAMCVKEGRLGQMKDRKWDDGGRIAAAAD